MDVDQSVQRYDGFLPGKHAIDAYGDGGFRFGGMSHRGDILVLPSGIHIWKRLNSDGFTEEDFLQISKEAADIELLYIGTGITKQFLSKELKGFFRACGIRGVETLSTGMAAQTYNILFAENRSVAAALLAVD